MTHPTMAPVLQQIYELVDRLGVGMTAVVGTQHSFAAFTRHPKWSILRNDGRNPAKTTMSLDSDEANGRQKVEMTLRYLKATSTTLPDMAERVTALLDEVVSELGKAGIEVQIKAAAAGPDRVPDLLN